MLGIFLVMIFGRDPWRMPSLTTRAPADCSIMGRIDWRITALVFNDEEMDESYHQRCLW